MNILHLVLWWTLIGAIVAAAFGHACRNQCLNRDEEN